MEFETILRCPVCGAGLIGLSDKRLTALKCSNGHSFDAAKEGYVNLLMSSKSSEKEHGDNKLMIDARRTFLEAGYYSVFRDAVKELLGELFAESITLCDIGCGEGWYTEAFAATGRVAAVDISKHAAKAAAKRLNSAFPGSAAEGRISVVCASAGALPLIDGSCDAAVNLFAPLDIPELKRILKEGGCFIYAVPTAGHLFGLKSILYDNPYKNEERDEEYDGFELVKRTRRESVIKVAKEHIMPLFAMTPYYYRTPAEGMKRLEDTDELTTEVGMDFIVYRRKAQ